MKTIPSAFSNMLYKNWVLQTPTSPYNRTVIGTVEGDVQNVVIRSKDTNEIIVINVSWPEFCAKLIDNGYVVNYIKNTITSTPVPINNTNAEVSDFEAMFGEEGTNWFITTSSSLTLVEQIKLFAYKIATWLY